MKIILGSDKSGFPLKEAIKAYFNAENIEYIEIGTTDINSPFPFFTVAPAACEKIQKGEAEKAILICGTGMGMSQVANKFKGVRAACVESLYSAKMCRAVNDSNVLCLGGWLIAPEMGVELVKAFLGTEFTQGLEEWRQDFLKNAKAEFAAIEDNIYCV